MYKVFINIYWPNPFTDFNINIKYKIIAPRRLGTCIAWLKREYLGLEFMPIKAHKNCHLTERENSYF